MRAIQNFETEKDGKHAKMHKADVTEEKLANLLPNRQDLFTRWKRLVATNKALLKAKYQPEWEDSKGDRFCRYRDELDSLETRKTSIGQMLTVMRSLKNEGQLKEFLQLQNSEEKCNEMLRKKDKFDKNQNTLRNSVDYKTLVQTNEETLKMRAEIKCGQNEIVVET